MEKIKLSNKLILEAFASIEGLKKLDKINTDVLYAVHRTSSKINEFVDAIKGMAVPSAQFSEYEKKRIELAKKHSKKDKDGNPILTGVGDQQSFVLDNQVGFEEEIKALQEDYKDELTDRSARLDALEAKLKEEVEVEVHKFKLESLPKEMPKTLFDGLVPLFLD